MPWRGLPNAQNARNYSLTAVGPLCMASSYELCKVAILSLTLSEDNAIIYAYFFLLPCCAFSNALETLKSL